MKKKTSKITQKKINLQIVKRKGHSEFYDEKKVYGSCFFACRNAHLNEIEAEIICEKVTSAVTKWIKKRNVVSSNEIFRFTVNSLKNYNEDVSFLYETHRDLS
ncbi:MAG TPA: ATP cone domain-containing protein [Candidatus Nanoarchaeia archaeon]|nr:ATP cone domain-containing protein [Candidatus Nanoarchaeia archaeon]